jgi:DNA modification methylase
MEEEEEEIGQTTIENVNVSDLTPHPLSSQIYDYRRNSKEIKILAKTIELVGLLEPIVINDKNQILSGNRRWRAFMFLGRTTIKAIRTTTNENEEQSIVFHNQQRRKTPREIINEAEAILGILGKNQGVRRDLMKEEKGNPFGSIGRDRFEIAAKVIGDISASSLRRIMDVVEFEKQSETNREIGLVERIIKNELTASSAHNMMRSILRDRHERKLEKKRIIKPIHSEDFTIYNKSSEKMDEVKDNSIQVVFTSPPYFNLRNYGNGSEEEPELGHESTPQEFVKNLSKHFRDVKRILKKEGSFFLNIGETYNRGANLIIPTRLLLELCDNEGWYIVNEIIWKKTNALPQGNTRRLQPTYEKIFHLVKDPENYFYQEFRIASENEIRIVRAPNDRNANNRERGQAGYLLNRDFQKFRDFLEEQNVFDIITGPNAGARQTELQRIDNSIDHPALMPDYLPLIPILTTSRIGDTILDPFSGSATTGKTSLLLSRKYIGYELNEDNYDLSIKSLNNVVEQIKLKEKNK